MIDTSAIGEHMEVVGSDGQHVGTVDKLQGNQIKLTKADPAAGGEHHFLPISAIQSVQDGKVTLSVPAQQAMSMRQGAGPQPAR